MQIQLENVKKIGRKIGINDDKGYLVAVLIVLIIVSALIASYYLVFNTQPAGYNTIFMQDAHKKAIDYPVTAVVNKNSTLNLWVGVVNNMGGNGNQSYQVLMKITQNLSGFPVNVPPTQTYNLSLKNTQTWQTESTITINQVGNYWIIFELWHQNSSGKYDFTNDETTLNVQVTS